MKRLEQVAAIALSYRILHVSPENQSLARNQADQWQKQIQSMFDQVHKKLSHLLPVNLYPREKYVIPDKNKIENSNKF